MNEKSSMKDRSDYLESMHCLPRLLKICFPTPFFRISIFNIGQNAGLSRDGSGSDEAEGEDEHSKQHQQRYSTSRSARNRKIQVIIHQLQ